MPSLLAQRAGRSGLLVDYTPVPRARGVVVFGHAGGSGRQSPRNRLVASILHDYGLSTVMADLLDDDEAGDSARLRDVELLAERLAEAMDWLRGHDPSQGHSPGVFAMGPGAAAALQVAARYPARAAAVVARGGRPNLPAAQLRRVRAPTLLIVGGSEADVVELNRRALESLRCEKRLEVLPGSTQRFEEPGALEAVAHLAGAWFAKHTAAPAAGCAAVRGA
jgi:dienelactone hydrolase